ncbi:putative peptidoglycan binding protein [Roseimicrobium gellanilyticum]|uniref:Putative peptidoglycan binding protein n=1 Tax=Roseimicrobium gellanilyticum TaxID=748857 RepID=A0A366HBY2_9BACT|nr:peptidoglycan-binding protein [Roseimicrobium gellanilyticum]RBP39787.1 putative peptidoglycan binding protein [Roseimicrobium gellanilyticum]
MKITSSNLSRVLTTATMVGVACLALPATSKADPFDFLKKKQKKIEEKFDRDRHDDHDHNHDHHHHGNRDRDDRYRRYVASPRSTFVITFGTGYAGQGYYYGPPNAPYYYQTPGVSYYRNRESVPRQYYPREWQMDSTDAKVQRALARRGYYNGPIDGSLGPGSRNAIARYQRDRGLPVTGTVTSSLLRSLGI